MEANQLFFTIHNLSGQSRVLDDLMIFGADYLIIITLVIVGIVAVASKKKTAQKAAGLAVLGIILAIGIIALIRAFITEPRPYITYPITPLIAKIDGWSFPSMHTTIMSAVASAFIFYRLKLAILLAIFALWVGFSRIFVGVHYPQDILAGIIVGFLGVLIGWNIRGLLKRRFL